MKKKGLSLAIFILLIGNEVVDAFAQFCFKKSAQAQGSTPMANIQDAYRFVSDALGQGYLWLGICAVAVVFVSWSTILSKIELSVATPITSSSYVFVALASLIFLHEHISLQRWAGICFILLGVAVVSLSANRGDESTS